LLGDWKRYAATQQGISWRSDESWQAKVNYIRMNPIRAGLIREGEKWPYLIEN
jgi:hypothetical protein